MPRNLEEQFSALLQLLEQGKYTDAILMMRGWQTTWLCKFCETNLAYNILKDEQFTPFWEEKLQTLSKDFQFVPQDRVSNLDLVLGYVFYIRAIKIKDSLKQASPEEASALQSDYHQCLNNAIKHQSFHAIQTMLSDIIIGTDATQKMQDLLRFIKHFSFLGLKFKTPGFLLLTTAYQQLSTLLNHDEDESSARREANKNLWVHLCLAQIHEEQSTPMIQNAYFGQGLRLSNPLRLGSIAEMKEVLRPQIAVLGVLLEAEEMAQNFMAQKEEEAKLIEWRHTRDRKPASRHQAPESPNCKPTM